MIVYPWPLRPALFEYCVVLPLSRLAIQRNLIATAIISMDSVPLILVPSRHCNPPQEKVSLDDRFDELRAGPPSNIRPTTDPWKTRLLAKDFQVTFPMPFQISGRSYEST